MQPKADQKDGATAPDRPAGKRQIAAALLRSGKVSSDEMLHALAHRGREAARLPEVLRARGLVDDQDLLDAEAQSWGLRPVRITELAPDPRLVDSLGAEVCLRLGLVPWRRVGDVTVVALSRPETFGRLRPLLEERLGPVCVGLAPAREIIGAIHALRGDELARAAEHRVPAGESCRDWPRLDRAP